MFVVAFVVGMTSEETKQGSNATRGNKERLECSKRRGNKENVFRVPHYVIPCYIVCLEIQTILF